MMTDTSTDRPRSLRLLIILLVGLACMDICMYVMLMVDYLKNEAYFGGLMIGQFAFAGVLAGSVGRAWVANLLLTGLLAITVTVTLLSLSDWPNWIDADEFIDPCLLIVGCTLPLLFCCSLPFLLTRAITGFRLSQQPATVGRSINMEDFFLATGVCAAMLVPVPAAFKVADETTEGIVEVMTTVGLVVGGVSLLVVLPSTVTYFILKRPAVRLVALTGICIGIPILMVWVLSLSGVLRLSGTTFLEEFAPPLATAAGCFAMCLVVLRAAGFAWLRDCKALDPVAVDPLADVEQPTIPNHARRRNRVATGALVLATAGFVLFCKNLELQRHELAERLTAIDNEWSTQAGSIRRYRYNIYTFTAPPNARLEDLELLLRANSLATIEVAGTDITDAMLAKIGSLSHLRTIDLSHTGIGDAGLRALKSASNLDFIDLSHTKVTAPGLQTFLAKNEHVHTLNLSGLGLTDGDIAKLPLASVSHLKLRHNPLTAAALPFLRHASMLDLSYTQIASADLTQLATAYLTLDYTPTTDEQIKALFESSRKPDGLSLRGTQVSDACLPFFAEASSLAFGDGRITQAGIAASGIASISQPTSVPPTGHVNLLALNDKQFDGSLFATRKWSVSHLDLRNSSISDGDIDQLANVVGLSLLNLRNCNISDAALPFLSSLSLSAVDLTGTKVTGEAASKFLGNVAVYIATSQCSTEVLIRHGDRWHAGGFMNEPLSGE